jgi:hypothetical protein
MVLRWNGSVLENGRRGYPKEDGERPERNHRLQRMNSHGVEVHMEMRRSKVSPDDTLAIGLPMIIIN